MRQLLEIFGGLLCVLVLFFCYVQLSKDLKASVDKFVERTEARRNK